MRKHNRWTYVRNTKNQQKPINNQHFHEIFSIVSHIFCNVYVDSGAQVYYRHISGQTMESPNGKLSEEKKNRLSKLEDGIKEQVTFDIIDIFHLKVIFVVIHMYRIKEQVTLDNIHNSTCSIRIKEQIALEIIATFHLKEHFQL